jgi:hypothetical protein
MDTKKCSGCQVTKDKKDFRKDSHTKDGLNHKCRDCARAIDRARYNANPGAQLLRSSQWRLNNQEKARRRDRKYYHKNPTKALKKAKAWRDSNPEWTKDYKNDKYKNNIQYRIASNIRSRFLTAIKKQSTYKQCSSILSLGCTVEFLCLYFESKFQNTRPNSKNEDEPTVMTWENHGVKNEIKGWCIDHIRPLISFDLTDPEQQKLACHYTNLQPLWWEDNLSKSDSW